MVTKTLDLPKEKPLVEAVRLDNKSYNILFKENTLFSLRVNGDEIVPVAYKVLEKSIEGYRWTYKGQIQKDLSAPPLAIDQVNSDSRGSIFAVKYMGAEIFSLIATKEGYARGGHSHPYSVNFSMPVGSGTWNILKGENWTQLYQMAGNSPITIGAGEVHYIVAKTDTLITESGANGEKFSSLNHQPTRDIVDSINKAKDNALKSLARN